MLNWFYDRSLEGEIELKATCAPHYFRVTRQRRVAERRAAAVASGPGGMHSQTGDGSSAIAPTEMMMPGSTGIELKANVTPASTGQGSGHPKGRVGGHPSDMNAMTKGCLAGSGVCFISHEGEVYPCGYLPVVAGDLRKQSFIEIWENSVVFQQLRDTGNLTRKCGCCEFRNICMGCRARAFAATGDYLDEEPFCVYQPRMAASAKSEQTQVPSGAAR
jgi:radical SAM protein with 4Fe4S-binding SPASM domain